MKVVMWTLPKGLQQRQLLYAVILSAVFLFVMRQAWAVKSQEPLQIIQQPIEVVQSPVEVTKLPSPVQIITPPAVETTQATEAELPPPPLEETVVREPPKIAKVTVAFGDRVYSGAERCLRTHQVQNDLYGYQHFIGNTKLVADKLVAGPVMAARWTKHAYLLNIILTELQKPEAERLQWLFWFDADTMILNPNIRLETFLPPASKPGAADLKFLIARNWDDINDGAFIIKVDIWSVTLLSGILAYPIDNLREKPFPHEQDVLSKLLHSSPVFQKNFAIVPHRWFNSFPVNNVYVEVNGKTKYLIADALKPAYMDDGERTINSTDGSDITLPWKVLKGNMVLHFAGVQHRKTWITPWADRAEQMLPEWSDPVFQERLQDEVNWFWDLWQPHIPTQIKGHKPIDALGNNTWF